MRVLKGGTTFDASASWPLSRRLQVVGRAENVDECAGHGRHRRRRSVERAHAADGVDRPSAAKGERMEEPKRALSKVPAITLGFWIIKILATTLGETGGDTVSMTWLGETTPERQPGSTAISSAPRSSACCWSCWCGRRSGRAGSTRGSTGRRSSPRPPAGTTLADFADRSLGIGYPGGSLLLLACVLAVAVRLVPDARHGRRQQRSPARAKRLSTGSRSLSRRRSAPRSATGSPDAGLGYRGGASGVRRRAGACSRCSISRPASAACCLFWAAFILTRPLGATVGDFLDKPIAKGGLEFSRPLASAVLAVAIVALILILPQRPGSHPGTAKRAREAGPTGWPRSRSRARQLRHWRAAVSHRRPCPDRHRALGNLCLRGWRGIGSAIDCDAGLDLNYGAGRGRPADGDASPQLRARRRRLARRDRRCRDRRQIPLLP